MYFRIIFILDSFVNDLSSNDLMADELKTLVVILYDSSLVRRKQLTEK
jgi:hypothetical protein